MLPHSRTGSGLRVFGSVLALVVAFGALIELWGRRSEVFINSGQIGSFHRSVYGLFSYMSRSEEVYGGTPGVVTHTTFSPLAICANVVATLAMAALFVALVRPAVSLAILVRPGVMALLFAGVGFVLPVTLIIVAHLTGWWPSSTFLVWPTARMFVASGAFGIVNKFWYEIAAMAIATNGAIYAAIGYAVSFAVKATRVAV